MDREISVRPSGPCSPREADLDALVVAAQSRLHSMGAAAFAEDSSFTLRQRARYIQSSSLDVIAQMQRLRQLALAILNGTAPPAADDGPESAPRVLCADCRHRIPSSWDAGAINCSVRFLVQDKYLPRSCSEFQAAPPSGSSA